VKVAREAGLTISFDPNLRLNLWPDAKAARDAMRLGWLAAHVIKVSEEELAFLGETEDLVEAACKLWHDDLRVLIITRGKAGCRYMTSAFTGDVPGFNVTVTDTTGAGDGFVAGVLKGLIEQPDAHTNGDRLRAICRYANAVGALTTTRRGAIPALPTTEQVEAFLDKQL
jgi:fructokinase